MAAGRIVISEFAPARDRNDALVAGAKMFVYTNGTTTLASIYTSAALTTALANPVVANSSGQFAQVWADASLLYTVSITGPNGESIGNPSVFDDYSPSTNFAVSQVEEYKAPVRVASTANITIASALINGSTIDGVVVATGDRVLLKDQSTGSQNGIYVVVASGAAMRAGDADTSAEVMSGMTMFVSEGTANGGAVFTLTTANPIVLGTTALVFSRYAAIGILPIANGGTGASDASTARTNLGLGSIATQAASSVTITGGSITGITDLAVADGGTGAGTADGALTNLGGTTVGKAVFTAANAAAARTATGTVIGTDVQAYDADLAAIAALTSAADKMPYATGAQTWALADLTSFARTLLATANNSAFLAALGQIASSAINFLQAGTGAINETLQTTLRRFAVTPEQYGAAGNGSTDDTVNIQKALDASLFVYFPGNYYISDSLTLRAGHRIDLSPTTTIRQYTVNKSGFVCTTINGVVINLNGGTLYGPGGWNNGGTWTGNQGNEVYRGIRFTAGERCAVYGPGKVVNWGNAGIAILGGKDNTVDGVNIEGVNGYNAVTIPADGNFNNGVYISNDATHGTADNIRVQNCTISGAAQGILRELVTLTNSPTQSTYLLDNTFRNIPGQHAIYNQAGFLIASGNTGSDIYTSLIKNQASVSTYAMTNIDCYGNTADNINGSLYETAALSGATIANIRLEGVGRDVGYLASINGPVSNIDVNVSGTTMTNAVIMQGATQARCSVRVNAAEVSGIGVVITSTGSDIDLYATLKNVNTSNGGTSTGDAIRVTSDNAVTDATTVRVWNANITDPTGYMTYGLRNSRAQSTTEVRGYLTVTGFANGVSIVDAGSITGVAQAQQDWTSYTPTFTASSGAFTTVTINSARYTYINAKAILVEFDFALTTLGTASGAMYFTVPLTAGGPTAGATQEIQNTGFEHTCYIRPSDLTKFEVSKYDGNTAIGAGNRFIGNITYRLP